MAGMAALYGVALSLIAVAVWQLWAAPSGGFVW
jgi:hypothetical protein